MVLSSFTVTFSDLALQIVAGALAAALTGRAFRGGGFGLIGDLIIGILGAVGANFVIGFFNLFNLTQFGLIGELIISIIGAIVLVVIVHLFTSRRTARAVE
jgi:uncharacterized membrane protein YeaQ/YmgE (transglycosylase-associated protein family)